MYQDTGFLEKSHLTFKRKLKQMIAQLAVISTTMPETRKDFIVNEGNRIGERLEEIIDDYEELIAECKLITDGASLLTGAVRYLYCLHTPHPELVSDLYRFGIS